MSVPNFSLTCLVFGAALLACGACDRILPQTGKPAPSEPAPGPAESVSKDIYDGLTMDQLKSMLISQGAMVTEIQPGFLRIEGGPILLLTQCQQDTCYEISIRRSFSNVRPTFDAINKWNHETKIPEASIDSSGYLHMEFWVTTVGITQKLLFDSIGWFEGALQEGADFWQPYVTSPGS